ncbi:hypothetical protein AYI69_g5869 [Smittium culicis]|uniref:TPR repeat-containing protein n=1 Tax=Smittium culicis TaxID=133412 RepID=A0A1R1Y2V6_9FUNG|nr:hypothetical protein AYI69_g5869 [Smittium culicis]
MFRVTSAFKNIGRIGSITTKPFHFSPTDFATKPNLCLKKISTRSFHFSHHKESSALIKTNNSLTHKRFYVIGKINDPFVAEKVEFYKPIFNFIVVVCVLSIVGISSYAYGSHWYIENCIYGTSENLDDETRRLVRAAMFRKLVNSEPRISKIYLERAIENLISIDALDYANPDVIDIYFMLADANISLGEQREAVQALELINIGLKLSDPISKSTNFNESIQGKSTSTKNFMLWYLNSKLSYSLIMGKLSMNNADYESATNHFSDSLNTIYSLLDELNNCSHLSESEILNMTYDINLKQSNLTLCLAEIYTISKKYSQAETLFNGALALVSQHSKDAAIRPPCPDYKLIETIKKSKASNPDFKTKVSNAIAEKLLQRKQQKRTSSSPQNIVDEWTCLDAVILNQMSQLYKITNKPDLAKSHATAAVNIASTHKDISSCQECAFYSYYMLGKLESDSGNNAAAIDFLQQALQLTSNLKHTSMDKVIDEIKSLYDKSTSSSQ